MAKAKKKESLTPEERLQAALVPESEQPYPVPGNWCWCYLRNIAFIRRGASPRPIKTYITENESGINWIKIGDTSGEKYITHVNEKITEEGAKRSVFVEEGTLLLSNSMSFGHPYILKVNGCIHDGWLALAPSEVINKEYLYYALLASEWYFEQVAVGTAVRNLNSERVSGTPTPLPPLSEQQRIVDRMESLFSKLDEAKQKAQDALDSFETRKAAILHKAFTGELTARWRKEHGVGMESWEKLKIGTYAQVKGGKRLPKGHKLVTERTAHPYLRIADFGDGTINVSDLHYITEDTFSQIKNYIINKEDVYISIVGSIGKAGVIPESLDGANLTENAARIISVRTLPQYLCAFLSSPEAQSDIQGRIRSATLGKLSLLNIKDIETPVPSINEQSEIVRILDDLLAKEQQAKEAAEGVLEQIDLMKKAILARAFRGELGTNDPREESAVELLKQVL